MTREISPGHTTNTSSSGSRFAPHFMKSCRRLQWRGQTQHPIISGWRNLLRMFRKKLCSVTSHYYPLGPPTDPLMTIDRLLHPGARFESSCRQPIELPKPPAYHSAWLKGNSCYNAGKPGVSHTFAGALWAADYCLQMASLGCVGVNLHAGANGYYSPIIGSIGTGFTARPVYDWFNVGAILRGLYFGWRRP